MALAGRDLIPSWQQSSPWRNVQEILASGDAATEIARVAREDGFDLIIMPTHSGIFRQMLLGSTTAKVINGSHARKPRRVVGGEPDRESVMTSIQWPLVEVAARLLERDEREAVLGDLLETGEGAWRGLLDVLGLVVRRQLLHWKNWQPWLATFGLAAWQPASDGDLCVC